MDSGFLVHMVTSDFRRASLALSYHVPKSENSDRKMVMEQEDKVRVTVMSELACVSHTDRCFHQR